MSLEPDKTLAALTAADRLEPHQAVRIILALSGALWSVRYRVARDGGGDVRSKLHIIGLALTFCLGAFIAPFVLVWLSEFLR